MTIKHKLLQEINKKAQKIRDKRVEAANNKTLENAVFDFFKNIEESRTIRGDKSYDPDLFHQAKKSLEERVRSYDRGAKISVEFEASDDTASWEQQPVRGVTIWWSQVYITKNNVDPSLFIDVSQMLFF